MADVKLAYFGAHDDRVQRQDGGHRRAGLNPFAHLDFNGINQSGEWRLEFKAVHGGAGQRQFSLGGIAGRAGAGDLNFGLVATGEQVFGDLQFTLTLIKVCLLYTSRCV